MATGRFTEDLPVWSDNLDQSIGVLPFQSISVSPWPIWHVAVTLQKRLGTGAGLCFRS